MRKSLGLKEISGRPVHNYRMIVKEQSGGGGAALLALQVMRKGRASRLRRSMRVEALPAIRMPVIYLGWKWHGADLQSASAQRRTRVTLVTKIRYHSRREPQEAQCAISASMAQLLAPQ